MLPSFQAPRYTTKEVYAYEVLRSAIIRCELRPGDRLVMEALGARLGVSSIPLRAALQRLQAEGLADIVPHAGAVVSEVSIDYIGDVFLLLEHLESAAFELLVERTDPGGVAQLSSIVTEMAASVASGTPGRWAELNRQLHSTAAALTGVRPLMEFTTRTLDSWDRVRRMYLQEASIRLHQAQAEHEEMVELLRRRELQPLLQLVVTHNRGARQRYRDLVAQMKLEAAEGQG
jgi:DNA-binding GntR family transcriptional regulator